MKTDLLDTGDLIFNYENLGLVRVDVCGNVVWRLPYRTHHSIWRDENAFCHKHCVEDYVDYAKHSHRINEVSSDTSKKNDRKKKQRIHQY